MRSFEVSGPDRVIFYPGAEAKVADALRDLGAERVLLVCLGRHREGADRVAAALGERCVGVFADAAPQVPRAVADAAIAAARAADADWVLAHGGGTAVGVAKAVALALDVTIAAVPNTYAGSERTNIWGITEGGEKTTGRDDRVRPRLVVYDPELTLGLPRKVSLLSLLNALAHSVEALYAERATARSRQAAADSLAPLMAGLTGLGADPHDREARGEALYGAWLAAESLAGASMALHHKLAHVLGGSFGTPHADTHATLLPYTMAFNLLPVGGTSPAPEALAVLRRAWGAENPAGYLHDRMRDLGLSVALKDLGLTRADLPRVAVQAAAAQAAPARGTARGYANPRPFDAASLEAMLLGAWRARRPTTTLQLGEPHE